MGDETIPQGLADLKMRIDEIAREPIECPALTVIELPAELSVRAFYFAHAHGMTEEGFITAALTISMDLYENN